ncbi:hypothetical protein LJC45_06210, partial [Alistipes sp. OttesenSCG-928-B03]|nr:hypothetical protein [Alistipes sp. OttesenSCG-928-B03]
MTTMLKSTTPASKTTKVSYPYYGNITTTEVDYQELECKEIAKADHIYPNLVTQAAHAVEGIERWNNEIQKSATRLFDQLGSETLHAQLEGIYSYLATEVDSMEDGEI